MEECIEILHAGNYSCVIENREIRTFSKPGVKDLYQLFTEDYYFLKEAVVADKVVGKAAAALMVLGGVRKVYTDVISLSALLLLHEAGIDVNYARVVPYIQNRNKTDWCPLECLCYKETSAKNILLIIETFIRNRN
ncbi:MAG: DUF1893 domain-containing protein [Tannerellaceae bacterium]|nr:DUF1893 domain-containing protein [Tannerellaceae bacterium]